MSAPGFTPEEARALLKILDEVRYIGIAEFVRLDDYEEAAVVSAIERLSAIAAKSEQD